LRAITGLQDSLDVGYYAQIEMRVRARPVLLLILLSSLVVSRAYPAQSTTAVEGVVLEGETDQPLSGVRVDVGPHGGTTNTEGRFRILVSPGRYQIVPTLNGFVYLRPSRLKAPQTSAVWVQVREGQNVGDIQLRLVRQGTITGRVVDANGQSMPGMSMQLLRYQYDDYGTRSLAPIPGVSVRPVRMDDRGEYRFFGLPPGDYYVGTYPQPVGPRIGAYYPGTPDETKALPVHVGAGEEVRLNTMTLQQARTVQVRFRFTEPPMGEPGLPGRTIGIGPNMELTLSASADGGPGQVILPAMKSGTYDLMLRSGDQFYSSVKLDVGTENIDREIVFIRGSYIAVRGWIEDASDQRAATTAFNCRIRSDSSTSYKRCVGQDGLLPQGRYWLELQDTAADTYVVSATVAGQDILRDGIPLEADSELDLVLASPGGVMQGIVRDSNGNTLSHAVVALVPDSPMRSAGPLYRSDISDIRGRFELRGIAPGSYRLFAWTELEGAAYRNPEFMKEFEERGMPVRIEKGQRLSMDIAAF
jgi:hypothetical protein